MKSLIVGDKPTVTRLAERLKRAESRTQYQRNHVVHDLGAVQDVLCKGLSALE